MHDKSGDPFPYYVPIAQFGLRLLGVYLFAVGASYLIQNLVEYLLFRYEYLGYASLIAAIIANVAYVAFGVYLILGGRWILEKVFLPPSDTDEDSDDE